jgi:hypothetical protein
VTQELILKRATRITPSGELKHDDYDVLCDDKVVGRIMKAAAAMPITAAGQQAAKDGEMGAARILVAEGFLWQLSGMDKLIPSLAVAALTGLTFLAYKHPNASAYLNAALTFVLVMTALGMAVWNLGVDKARLELIKFLKPETWKESSEAIKSSKAPMSWFLAALGLTAYLWFLLFLPLLLAK